eukprot:99407-Amorphochlora_amoeboformis.AAC.1
MRLGVRPEILYAPEHSLANVTCELLARQFCLLGQRRGYYRLPAKLGVAVGVFEQREEDICRIVHVRERDWYDCFLWKRPLSRGAVVCRVHGQEADGTEVVGVAAFVLGVIGGRVVKFWEPRNS